MSKAERKSSTRTALNMLTAIEVLKGLTAAEREKVREIAAIEPMFGPRIAERGSEGGAHA